jgi:[ribosomal protein S5]-alanine N-acetyltransferase
MTTSDIHFLIGERIYLRPLTDEDADGGYLTWFNDEVVCSGNSHHIFPYSRDKLLEFIHQSRLTKDELVLAIVLRSGNNHIGNIALQNINYIFRSAELSIIIGDKTTWKQGFGEEASNLILKHAFFTMNLRRISCGTFDTNEGMKNLAHALGMKEEGRRIEAAYKNGKYVDIIEYGLLRSGYDQK